MGMALRLAGPLAGPSTANACSFHDRLANFGGFAQCVEQLQIGQEHKIVWYFVGVVGQQSLNDEVPFALCLSHAAEAVRCIAVQIE